MKLENNKQEARDNSVQVSTGDIIVNGLTESTAYEILQKNNQMLREEMRKEINDAINDRQSVFNNIFVPTLASNNLMPYLLKPEIINLYQKASISAACTDREKDYEILSQLLIHRIKRDGDYSKKAAISKAIDAVIDISDEALLGLTLTFAVETYSPVNGKLSFGLKTLDDLFDKIIGTKNIMEELNNKVWIDNLDTVNAIRPQQNTTRKKLEDFYIEVLNGYVCVGIDKESEDYNKAKKILFDAKIPQDILVENELDNKKVRLAIPVLNSFSDIKIITNQNYETSLTEEQKNALKEIQNLYEPINSHIKEKFIDKLHEFRHIDSIIEWWDNSMTKSYFVITPIGKVLAHTNAKTIDDSLPDLD